MSAGSLRCLKSLDERVSVKLLLRVWGPRFEFVVRLLLVTTFLDDSLRVATDFSDHTKQIEQGYLASLATASPDVIGVIVTAVLRIGFLIQLLGSMCLLAHIQPHGAINVLIGWGILHPVLYAQLTNVEFLAETLTLIGGLLILRAHLSERARLDGQKVPLGGGELCTLDDSREAAIARTQLIGRLMLPAVYMYRAIVIMRDFLTGAVDHSQYTFPMLATEHAVNFVVYIGIVLGCILVAFGLKSRTVALLLAFVNFVFVCYQYPFFCFAWREGGEWKYDELRMRQSMPNVALRNDASPDELEPWQIYDMHRYYFFLGLSASGSLLLLAQFGPGKISYEADEVLVSNVQLAARD